MISCPTPKELEAYLHEKLTAARHPEFEGHIGECSTCRQRLEELTGGNIPQGSQIDDNDAIILEKIKKNGPPPPSAQNSGELGCDSKTVFPSIVGPYQIENEIARGGMGQVLRARDPKFKRSLAVKLLLSRFAGDSIAESRFLQEANLTGNLQHPGIPPVHDLGHHHDGRPFFAMKLIEGETLADQLKKRPSPNADLPRFLAIFEQIAQTLGYAHEKGVIHRDLKPHNIMVGKFGEVHVMDWGLAKEKDGQISSSAAQKMEFDATHEKSGAAPAASEPKAPARPDDQPLADTIAHQTKTPSSSTRAGDVFGTFPYMPPEQARGEVDKIDERSDVFGLGGILCVILTGQPPYAGESNEANRRLAAGADLVDAYSRLDDCGADVELIELTRRCLAKDKDNRPQNSGKVGQEISKYLAAVQERLQQEREQRAKAEVRVREERKRRVLSVAVGSLLVLIAIGLGVAAWWYQAQRYTTETNVGQAVAEAYRLRQILHKQLGQNGGVFRLLDDPSGWEAQIKEARAALEKARALQANAGFYVSSSLNEKLNQLAKGLKEDDDDRRLALELEDIREMKSTLTIADDFDYLTPPKRFREAFSKVDLFPSVEHENAVSKRIRESLIREHLVVALDEWAMALAVKPNSDRQLQKRVLRLSYLSDSEPRRRQLRDLKVWADSAFLQELSRKPTGEKLPAHTLFMIAFLNRLHANDTEEFLRKSLNLHPTDFWLNFELAYILNKKGKFGAAEMYYRVAAAVRPDSYVAYLNLGLVLSKQRKTDEAIVAFRNAIKIAPDSPLAYIDLGVSLEEQKRFDDALSALNKAIQLKSDYPLGWYNLGSVLRHKNKLDDAMAAFRKAIELKPNYAKAHYNLGWCLDQKGKLNAAVVAYREAVQINSKFVSAWYNLGTTLEKQRKLDEAATAYRRSLECEPKKIEAYIDLGRVQRKQNKFAEAVESFQKALQVNPKYAVAHFHVGLVKEGQKNFDEAIAAFRKAIQFDPEYVEAYNNLGLALHKIGDLEGSLSELRKAASLDPGDSTTLSNLGSILFAKKDYDGA